MAVLAMSAADTILADLEAASPSWICGVTVWNRERYISSFAQRISLDLRAKRGLPIESRVCDQHPHRSTCHMYRLRREPEQTRLAV
jgi:hypothetical protein